MNPELEAAKIAVGHRQQIIKYVVGGFVALISLFFFVIMIIFVLFFGKKSEASCSGVSATAIGTKLDQAETAALQANTPFYQKAAAKTKVPWQVFASIHYRENNFKKENPGNGQGIFQFVNGEGGPYPPGPVSDEEFERQLEYLGGALQNNYVQANYPPHRKPLSETGVDSEEIKDTFFSYNGRAKAYIEIAGQLGFDPNTQGYEGSPYVMNDFDDKHKDMKKIGTDFGPVDTVDQQLGAFVIYSMSAGAGACGTSGNDIVDVARTELAKNIHESPDGCNCGPGIDEYTDNHHEFWCADFVSWVYKQAGVPFTGGDSGGWRIAGVKSMIDWFKANAQYYDRSTSSPAPKPGSVIFFYEPSSSNTSDGYHVGIVDHVDGDKAITIEGNTGNSVASHTYQFASDSTVVGWGNLK